MNAEPENSYDRVPYSSHPSRLTHPDNLATLAVLFGLTPAPVECCRVLELGCGNGANLIPMALTLPGSRFTGIDLAGTPIAAARTLTDELGLGNIEFHQRDIMELEPGFAEFDYIIAHGVYSWVPPPVRDKLLAVCRSSLAPHGVAFLSYNTFPGCHMRKMIREMLEYQTRDIADPELRLKHAFALVNFLAASNPRTPALREEVNAIRSRDPSVVFHDDLASVNEPVYFHQFMEHARGHGLQFLAEAEFFSMRPDGFDEEIVRTIRLLAGDDRIRTQQYLDFLKCRRFRQTLLCHAGVPLEDPPKPERVTCLCVSSAAKPVNGPPDPRSDAEAEYQSGDGASMSTNLPLAKAAILQLAECWPRAVPFSELLSEVGAVLGTSEDAATLAGLLMKIYSSGLLELQLVPSRFTLTVSERPRAFSLARIQARIGSQVTTLRHSTVEIEDALGLRLVTLLDGTRDRSALLKDLETTVDLSQRAGALREEDLDKSLNGLARLALLEA